MQYLFSMKIRIEDNFPDLTAYANMKTNGTKSLPLSHL